MNEYPSFVGSYEIDLLLESIELEIEASDEVFERELAEELDELECE